MRAIEPHLRGVRTLIGIRAAGTGLTEDILQETLAAAWAHRAEVRDADKLRAWLFEIARNKCRDAWRRSGRELPVSDSALEAGMGSRGRDDPQNRFIDLRAAVGNLPPRRKRGGGALLPRR